MAHLKSQENTCHRLLQQNAKFTTLIYIFLIYLVTWVLLSTHEYLRTHIYKALHQCYIKITFLRSKSIKRSPRGFVQYSTWLLSIFNLVCGNLQPAKRPSACLSLSFLSKLSWYKNAHLELSTNGHPTLELFQKWHRFYRYIAIWLCIYLQCIHGLTTTADRIRASLSWQDYHTGGTCRKGWLNFFGA